MASTSPLVTVRREPASQVDSKAFVADDVRWTRLVYTYTAAAAGWLIFGTLVGLYVSFKFIWPDMEHISWLSFGRIRPVHTNTVFWAWGTLGMMAAVLYVIPRTSHRNLYSIPMAWLSFWLVNISIAVGDILLMAGINNGGQEYREYIWPVELVFAIGIILLIYNLGRTMAERGVEEVYISNWYIMGGLLWTAVVVIIAYIPFYQQNAISETVVQGYFMHMGVGMWFTPIVLGLTYYALPSQLKKPIFSYNLGVLAFWGQLVFYTMIGAHHFIFAPTPWWLQTTAIIFSFAMVITLAAGTGNFLLTMKGSGRAIARSYPLQFILVGVISYFVFSFQGSLEALRELQAVWHFTQFTVGHSHLTMYGFVTLLMWGALYGIIPQMTKVAPKRAWVGVHFWFAVIGITLYGGSLSIGGTVQGLSWIAENAFIESVVKLAPYWAWRGVGGTLMFLSHIVFAYNVWCMRPGAKNAVSKRAAA